MVQPPDCHSLYGGKRLSAQRYTRLSSIDADRIEPDCVREYARLDFLNQDTAAQLTVESDEKLYRYILVEQCNALGKIMPKMFTHIGGIAALLLPERLYIKDCLVHDLTHIKDVKKKISASRLKQSAGSISITSGEEGRGFRRAQKEREDHP